ncbi:MAG: DJ-1 family protein [Elusimicrobia bacterium CG08_land_8_20_14_0_20_51_18]|nr:MAG: DJ-1 family protein [Elusimicrobia bacterium CG08_land_8_20_14_0_20_51_18]
MEGKMKKVALFIAYQGFRDEEYAEPKRVLEAAGIKVDTVSTALGKARGKIKITADVDKLVKDVRPEEYSCLALVGGPGALEQLDTPEIHGLFSGFLASGKPIAAICISPVILGRAGLLKGRKATVWEGGAEELKKAGAVYTGNGVEIDGKIITADGPASAAEYGRAIVEMIK